MNESICDRCLRDFFDGDEKYVIYPNDQRNVVCWDCHEELNSEMVDYEDDEETLSIEEIDAYIEEYFRTGGM